MWKCLGDGMSHSFPFSRRHCLCPAIHTSSNHRSGCWYTIAIRPFLLFSTTHNTAQHHYDLLPLGLGSWDLIAQRFHGIYSINGADNNMIPFYFLTRPWGNGHLLVDHLGVDRVHFSYFFYFFFHGWLGSRETENRKAPKKGVKQFAYL